jgi:hypothetical protein
MAAAAADTIAASAAVRRSLPNSPAGTVSGVVAVATGKRGRWVRVQAWMSGAIVTEAKQAISAIVATVVSKSYMAVNPVWLFVNAHVAVGGAPGAPSRRCGAG